MPHRAEETPEAPLIFGNDKVSECTWYATGLEGNEAWTGLADLEVWAWVDWNQSWMMTGMGNEVGCIRT